MSESDSRDSAGQSADLRTRIAAVLAQHYPQTTGYQDELTDWCQCGMPRDHVADVLIRDIPELQARCDCQIRNWAKDV